MEPSPLTQDARPESFQPKITRLYETLFRDTEEDHDYELSEGFWEEFFLLRPDRKGLKRVIESVSPDGMLRVQGHSQQLFLGAIKRIRLAKEPSDEIALDTLTIFLDLALSKKYTNPNSDVLSVLAGLDDADTVVSDFVATIDTAIRNGRNPIVRLKAVRAALAMTAGSFHTGLPSYFTHRDLFPSLMKYIQDSESSSEVTPAFYLLGLLANYNRFEFQNPYRLRMDDFVNDGIIQKIIVSFGNTCASLRDAYVAVQDDIPEGWTLGSTLNMIGLGVLAPASRPKTPALSAEETKALFAALPGPAIGLVLSTYDFANANKLFCFNLVTIPAPKKGEPSPLSSFFSLTSYLFQHAHRTSRAALYTYLTLFILQILVEDQILVKRLSSEESAMSVRLCRQRQPYLPAVKGDRVPTAVILDLLVDGINHNLKKRLDVDYYILCLGVLLRILSYLSRAKCRIAYHWSELWRSLLSFFRFLSTYPNDIRPIHGSSEMIDRLVSLLAFALSNGENFLPDPVAYDDLFYKIVEQGETLTKFRDAYNLETSGQHPIQTLLSVSSHYHTLLQEKGKARSKHLSPQEVSNVIKQGYETLSIEAGEGLDRWEKFREADFKAVLKRVARAAVDDAKTLLVEK
ncbi:DUF1741-domain-containing protein [Westerdykella ornata]|uniref:DUF1741-domain-containing protein n=1 Tax=Westerdykella ornata TaxID=318751 RepID=A0A6A6JM65_WESOR|nr:DUF1741-domain-containing protein [Westerdykella ornata]KAF2277592.1 DUF1741-domain-containing protein [Westerdykella ornata]